MCLCAAFAGFAQETVVYTEDWEWLEPWTVENPEKLAEQTVETNNPNAASPQLGTNKIDGVTTYAALLEKGYSFPICCAASKNPRPAEQQVYLQQNYLKFGLTGYYSGLTFPAFTDVPADLSDSYISFKWCGQRQGSGKWDDTELVIIVKNGDTEEQFTVPTYTWENNHVYEWIPATIQLGNSIKEGSVITIRNCDAQWPDEGGRALRWFIDDIKVAGTAGAAVEEIEVADATAEYFNLQGVRVSNPTNGLYIVRKGANVSKVLVK